MNRFQELVRARLRERTPNYSTLARFLKADPSTIQKRLREGGPDLSLDWLDEVVQFYQMSVSEMCALPEATWQEVKPLEAQVLQCVRGMNELERRSLLTLLERPMLPARDRRSRWGRAMLTLKEQELIDLFARAKDEATREGVIKILRASVTARAAQRTNE